MSARYAILTSAETTKPKGLCLPAEFSGVYPSVDKHSVDAATQQLPTATTAAI